MWARSSQRDTTTRASARTRRRKRKSAKRTERRAKRSAKRTRNGAGKKRKRPRRKGYGMLSMKKLEGNEDENKLYTIVLLLFIKNIHFK